MKNSKVPRKVLVVYVPFGVLVTIIKKEMLTTLQFVLNIDLVNQFICSLGSISANAVTSGNLPGV